jgi:hypothetical protein
MPISKHPAVHVPAGQRMVASPMHPVMPAGCHLPVRECARSQVHMPLVPAPRAPRMVHHRRTHCGLPVRPAVHVPADQRMVAFADAAPARCRLDATSRCASAHAPHIHTPLIAAPIITGAPPAALTVECLRVLLCTYQQAGEWWLRRCTRAVPPGITAPGALIICQAHLPRHLLYQDATCPTPVGVQVQHIPSSATRVIPDL